MLEVGCGPGTLAKRVREDQGISLCAIDLSERMVDLAHDLGVSARVGDVQAMPFADATFDCVIAAWMLYHVPDLDLGAWARSGGCCGPVGV
ncbi:MAG: class I SAM-dependent methyltransferase [Actinomycetota bacterium]|nr:class I SAM-dependent methyltransferase [Actinomycetota bacterium]